MRRVADHDHAVAVRACAGELARRGAGDRGPVGAVLAEGAAGCRSSPTGRSGAAWPRRRRRCCPVSSMLTTSSRSASASRFSRTLGSTSPWRQPQALGQQPRVGVQERPDGRSSPRPRLSASSVAISASVSPAVFIVARSMLSPQHLLARPPRARRPRRGRWSAACRRCPRTGTAPRVPQPRGERGRVEAVGAQDLVVAAAGGDAVDAPDVHRRAPAARRARRRPGRR